MELPKRKPVRAKDYDYSQAGAYFVTICTKNKRHILGNIVGGDVLGAPKIKLSDYGKIVDNQIKTMNTIYENISVDTYVVMPNHIHLIITIDKSDNGTSRTPSPTSSTLPQFVSTFKRFVNRQIGYNIFQRSYHDHIIRNEKDYTEIYTYIENNPAKWAEDRYYQL